MKHFYIIRHGETEYNKLQLLQGRGIDASLNERGVEQAIAVAKTLKAYPISRVVTSSLKRAKESAQEYIKISDVSVENWSDLDEMSFGELEAKPFGEVMDQLKHLQKVWASGDVVYKIPGGESPLDVYERASSRMIEIANRAKEEHIAIFIHGRLIRILLSGLLGMGLENMQQIQHENGAINHIIWNDDRFSAKELNITDHLSHLKNLV